MADAFLSNRTMSLIEHLKQIRPTLKSKLDINNFNPNSHITAHILGVATNPHLIQPTKANFINHIIMQLKQNKKLCIVCSSKTFKQDIINAALQSSGKEFIKSILQYDGDTDDMAIEDLGQVQQKWSDPYIRMVIYTTKITVGISFDVPNIFNSIYIYGSVNCPIIRDLMQSHFRVRHTIDNTIYVAMNTCKIPETSTHEEEMTLAYAKSFLQTIKTRFKKFQTHDDIDEANTYLRVYETIIQYNLLEEKLGYSLYTKMFQYFLQKIGYQIKHEELDTKHVVTLYEDQDIFPHNYVKDYIKYRNTPREEIEQIEKRKKSCYATTEDKQISNAFYFYKSIITKTRLHNNNDHIMHEQLEQVIITSLPSDICSTIRIRAAALEHTILEQVECELFNIYLTDTQVKKHAKNIITEMTLKNIDDKYLASSSKTIHDQRDTIRLDYICQLKDILGLDTSFDIQKTLTTEDMKTFLKYYLKLGINQKVELHELFRIELRNQKYMSAQQAVTIIDQMLEYWNGCSLTHHQHKTIKGKRLYKYTIDCTCTYHNILYKLVSSFMVRPEQS